MAPNSTHVPKVGLQIATQLKSPDLMFIQEIQDDTGPTSDGVVGSDLTLTTLTGQIASQGGAQYSFTYISPVDGQDGGQPGGNIRQAYLCVIYFFVNRCQD